MKVSVLMPTYNRSGYFLENATGDLICLLFDDDVLEKNGITLRVKEFKNNSFVEVVYSGWKNVMGSVIKHYEATAPSPIYALKKEYINFTTMMWRSDVKHKFMFDEELHYNMDTIFKIRCMMECCVLAIKESTVFYTIHSGQETNKMPSEIRTKELELVKQKIKQLYQI